FPNSFPQSSGREGVGLQAEDELLEDARISETAPRPRDQRHGGGAATPLRSTEHARRAGDLVGVITGYILSSGLRLASREVEGERPTRTEQGQIALSVTLDTGAGSEDLAQTGGETESSDKVHSSEQITRSRVGGERVRVIPAAEGPIEWDRHGVMMPDHAV